MVIKKLEKDKSAGTLLVPMWRSAAFWPIVCPNGNGVYANFIQAAKELPCDSVRHTRCRSGIFSGNPSLQMVALRISFDVSCF